jgi:hypothetical protein
VIRQFHRKTKKNLFQCSVPVGCGLCKVPESPIDNNTVVRLVWGIDPKALAVLPEELPLDFHASTKTRALDILSWPKQAKKT